jgi:hypothetical protein
VQIMKLIMQCSPAPRYFFALSTLFFKHSQPMFLSS